MREIKEYNGTEVYFPCVTSRPGWFCWTPCVRPLCLQLTQPKRPNPTQLAEGSVIPNVLTGEMSGVLEASIKRRHYVGGIRSASHTSTHTPSLILHEVNHFWWLHQSPASGDLLIPHSDALYHAVSLATRGTDQPIRTGLSICEYAWMWVFRLYLLVCECRWSWSDSVSDVAVVMMKH